MVDLAYGSTPSASGGERAPHPAQSDQAPEARARAHAASSPDLPLSVLLVDDQPSALALMRAMLSDPHLVTVVGEALSGAEALALLPSLLPALAVVDVEMPGMHGFETARRMRAALPALRVVLVSAAADPQYEALAQAAGALAFLPKKDLSPTALVALLSGQPPR